MLPPSRWRSGQCGNAPLSRSAPLMTNWTAWHSISSSGTIGASPGGDRTDKTVTPRRTRMLTSSRNATTRKSLTAHRRVRQRHAAFACHPAQAPHPFVLGCNRRIGCKELRPQRLQRQVLGRYALPPRPLAQRRLELGIECAHHVLPPSPIVLQLALLNKAPGAFPIR